MTRKKDAVALFEVMKSRRAEGLNVPGWMGRPDESAPSVYPQQPAGEVFVDEQPVSTAGGRLRFSLNYLGGTILIGLIVASWVIAFFLGRSSAGKAPVESAASGRPAPAAGENASVGAGAGALAGESGPAPASAQVQRQVGKYYLIIQALAGISQADLAAANKIADYVRGQGEPATVNVYVQPGNRRQRYIVWSGVPFDSATGQQARTYAQKIEGIGKKFLESGGRYDFRQRNSRGEFDPWFQKHQ